MINFLSLNYQFNFAYYKNENFVLALSDKDSKNWGFNFWKLELDDDKINPDQLVFYQNPIYKNYAFNYKIDKFLIDNYNHYPKIYLDITYLYKEYIFDFNSKKFYYNDSLPTNLKISVNINNKYQEIFNFDQISQFKEKQTIILEPEIDCYQNDISINLECSSEYGYFYQKNIYLNTKIEQDYNLNFGNNLFFDLLIPIGYQDNQIIYDQFYFLKLFRTNFYYPKNIKFLLLFYYNDPNNWLIYPENDKLEGYINLNGIDDDSQSFVINFYTYHNFFLFYIDDFYYYDYKNKESINGINSNFDYKKAIVLPWDYSNNRGYIQFNISFVSYLNYQINFDLYFPIQIKNSARGENNSKFQLIEIFDYSDFNNQNIIWDQYE